MTAEAHARSRNTISIDGIVIDVLRLADLFAEVRRFIHEDGRRLVTYVNVHTMNLARDHESMRQCYELSSLTYCDGAGVLLGARLLGLELPERMTSASFIYEFCQDWQQDGTRIFFLGGKPEVAAVAAKKLRAEFSDLQIVGTHDGYFRHHHQEEEDLLEQIEMAAPDILFVGLGSPNQERWILRNWERLSARVVWPIGAMVDYVSGEVVRAPQWMQGHSLEWLFRFILEPRRMFRRYIIGNPKFVVRILSQRGQEK